MQQRLLFSFLECERSQENLQEQVPSQTPREESAENVQVKVKTIIAIILCRLQVLDRVVNTNFGREKRFALADSSISGLRLRKRDSPCASKAVCSSPGSHLGT